MTIEQPSGKMPQQFGWEESDSAHFIDLGKIYTPRRDDLTEMFLDLIPAETNDAFTGVELGTGAGWLIEAILRRYPRANMLGLDGSETMLKATGELLAPLGKRSDLRLFRLEDGTWRAELPEGLRCIVSSLVIHHLEGPEKARLYRDLFTKLAPGGALLIADVVEPANAWGQRALARAWDRVVERQSQELAGDDSAYRQFLTDRWNIYRYREPDDIDHPSTLLDQLQWLDEAGFIDIDVFWADAGHALFGGYKG